MDMYLNKSKTLIHFEVEEHDEIVIHRLGVNAAIRRLAKKLHKLNPCENDDDYAKFEDEIKQLRTLLNPPSFRTNPHSSRGWTWWDDAWDHNWEDFTRDLVKCLACA